MWAGVEAHGAALWPMLAHAGLLMTLLLRLRRCGIANVRIDALLAVSLAYILCFCVPPLVLLRD